MRLKRLEISGFKSFRDKVTLDFSGGISAVVGPNGCGKSNIVDAIRWVMGEQRMKALRGKKTDDVIFNGSEGAAPVGMAEISMTLSNGDGKDFPGDYASFNEVTVSRRLFRDGESEYSLNKVPCRLLDVREFFMGTGIGVRTYSLVEQNSVASLVEAKPEDRRQFIEEAAGISKYKSRKESAVRKMEATRQNMLRVSDIIREVKSQLNALSRQAKRAEQYRSMKKNIRETELILSLQAYSELSDRNESLEQSLSSYQQRDEEIRTSLKSEEASLEQQKTSIMEIESVLSDMQEQQYTFRNTISIKEQEIDFHKKKIEDLVTHKQRAKSDLERLHSQLESSEQEKQSLHAASGQFDEDIMSAEKAVSETQTVLEELKKSDRDVHRTLEEKKVRYIDVVTRKTNLKNMQTHIVRGIEDIKKREEKDLREEEEQKKRFAEVARLTEENEISLAADETMLDELIVKRGDVADELEKSKTELLEGEERLSQIKGDIGSKRTRLESLREFQEGYEWCSEATKVLMSAKPQADHEGLSRSDFLGLVADHINVPRDYEMAVEAVLGEKLQYILVKSHNEGVKAIDYLKSSSLGRCSFVPLEGRFNGSDSTSWDHLNDAVRLVDVVDTKEDFKDIAHYLLGDVLLIPNLRNGIALWKQNGFVGTFVTPEGDIISPHGVLTGGSRTNGDRSLLRDKREINELEEDLKALNASLERETELKQKTNRLISQWEEELVQLRSQVHRLEIQINSRKKDLERFEDETKRLQQRLNILAYDRANLIAEMKEATEKRDALTRDLTAIDEEEKEVNDSMAALQGEWESIRNNLEKIEGSHTEQKVLLASLLQSRETNEKALERIEASIKQMHQEIQSRSADMDAGSTEVDELKERIVSDQQMLEQLYRDRDTIDAELAQMREQHQEKETALKAIEARIKETGRQLEETVQESKEFEVQSREVVFQMESIKQNLQQRDYSDLSDIIESFERLDSQKINELQEKLSRDRQAVESFGEVNLLAVDEYEQLKERHDFLSAQSSDLNASLESLQKTITRINQISRKRFAETFEAVNVCFKDVFSRLFPGGRGELRLTDESDMLETGVEIDIQVPGKKTQNITLLSGGEKSLAAIALIFAIIYHRPSPFLVLDEVDAALDDANISLFNGLLKNISAHSQIIMVTHNKRSMEVAGNMFGITMQQQGISTMVSVNLQ